MEKVKKKSTNFSVLFYFTKNFVKLISRKKCVKFENEKYYFFFQTTVSIKQRNIATSNVLAKEYFKRDKPHMNIGNV